MALSTDTSPLYTADFYAAQSDGSLRSAGVAVPRIMALIQPGRVVDVGCGVGTWLSVFQQQGVTDVLGIDGDYVDRAALRIPAGDFMPWDLSEPIHIDRSFDLALSLEVAEHLPEAAAATFVQSLTRLAPVVVFSAATPFQGGTGHINEQWPDYWAGHFAREGYQVVDCLRQELWADPQVEVWYAQNMLLFVRADRLSSYPSLSPASMPLNLVHPGMFLRVLDDYRNHFHRLIDEARSDARDQVGPELGDLRAQLGRLEARIDRDCRQFKSVLAAQHSLLQNAVELTDIMQDQTASTRDNLTELTRLINGDARD